MGFGQRTNYIVSENAAWAIKQDMQPKDCGYSQQKRCLANNNVDLVNQK